MPKLSVYDLSGAQTGEIELNDFVFVALFFISFLFYLQFVLPMDRIVHLLFVFIHVS